MVVRRRSSKMSSNSIRHQIREMQKGYNASWREQAEQPQPAKAVGFRKAMLDSSPHASSNVSEGPCWHGVPLAIRVNCDEKWRCPVMRSAVAYLPNGRALFCSCVVEDHGYNRRCPVGCFQGDWATPCEQRRDISRAHALGWQPAVTIARDRVLAGLIQAGNEGRHAG